jgi:hypothetical protein
MAGIIRQLADVSRHADEIFGDLLDIAEDVAARTSSAHDRLQQAKLRMEALKTARTTSTSRGKGLGL